MPESFTAQTLPYPNRDRDVAGYGAAKADSILARADRREPAPVAALENASFDKMDKIAALVAAIMTIGPLFAAFVGRMHE
jgi:hypothetical protein